MDWKEKTGLVGPVLWRREAARLHRRRRDWRQGAAGLVVASFGWFRTTLASRQSELGASNKTDFRQNASISPVNQFVMK